MILRCWEGVNVDVYIVFNLVWLKYDKFISFFNDNLYFYLFYFLLFIDYNLFEIKKEYLILVFYDEYLLNILIFINNYLIIFIRCENEKIIFS